MNSFHFKDIFEGKKAIFMSTLNRLIYTATPRGIKYRSGIRYVDYTQENIAFSYLCWNVQKASVWHELIDMHILHIWQVSLWGKVQNCIIKLIWLMMSRENFSTDLQLCLTWEKFHLRSQYQFFVQEAESQWYLYQLLVWLHLRYLEIPSSCIAGLREPGKAQLWPHHGPLHLLGLPHACVSCGVCLWSGHKEGETLSYFSFS